MICFPNNQGITSGITQYLLDTGIRSIKVDQNVKLFCEGEENNHVFFIEEGIVKIGKTDVDGNIKLVGFGRNEALGMAGFFSKGCYQATATTVMDCIIYKINRKDMNQLIAEVPPFRDYVFLVMDEYISYYINNVISQTYNPTDIQLAHVLHNLAGELGREQTTGAVLIDMKLTDEILSNIIGTSRETVSRILCKFKDAGWINKKNKYISIIDKDLFEEHFIKPYR